MKTFREKDMGHYKQLEIDLDGAFIRVMPMGHTSEVEDLRPCEVSLLSTITETFLVKANFVTWRVARFLIQEDWGEPPGRVMRIFEMLKRAG